MRRAMTTGIAVLLLAAGCAASGDDSGPDAAGTPTETGSPAGPGDPNGSDEQGTMTTGAYCESSTDGELAELAEAYLLGLRGVDQAYEAADQDRVDGAVAGLREEAGALTTAMRQVSADLVDRDLAAAVVAFADEIDFLVDYIGGVEIEDYPPTDLDVSSLDEARSAVNAFCG